MDGRVSIEIPTVVTPRLVLRGWTSDDIARYAEIASEPGMYQYTGAPANESAVWKMVAGLTGHWALRGFGVWAAVDRNTGGLVGRAGLSQGYRWPDIQVLWTIRTDRWGQGLATEGGAAAVEFAFTHAGARQVVSLVHEDNAASRRVAEKLGLTYGHTERFGALGGAPTSHYWITRDQWAARRDRTDSHAS